jgi:uncharacterized damage-inducible protein DinB
MQISAIEPFLRYFDGFRKRTLRIADRIPPERLEWTYREGKFTFGDILRHLGAIERYMFAENACRRPSRYPGHSRDLATGYDEVRSFLDRMHSESVELLSALGPDDLLEKCLTPAGIEITVWKWLRAMVEHEAHHRGQLYLYLALLGIDGPPLYGLTEEEVAARSRPGD